MKLNLLLLYSTHAAYRRIQIAEMQKSLSKTSFKVKVIARGPILRGGAPLCAEVLGLSEALEGLVEL